MLSFIRMIVLQLVMANFDKLGKDLDKVCSNHLGREKKIAKAAEKRAAKARLKIEKKLIAADAKSAALIKKASVADKFSTAIKAVVED